MKNKSLSKIALMGLASGLVIGSQGLVQASDIEASSTLVHGGCNSQPYKGNYWYDEGMDFPAAQPNQSNQQVNNNSYPADNSAVLNQPSKVINLSDKDISDFRNQLDDKSQPLFDSFDKAGKVFAIQLSKKYSDKNEAVRVAAQKISQKDSYGNPNVNSNANPNAWNNH